MAIDNDSKKLDDEQNKKSRKEKTDDEKKKSMKPKVSNVQVKSSHTISLKDSFKNINKLSPIKENDEELNNKYKEIPNVEIEAKINQEIEIEKTEENNHSESDVVDLT